MSRIPLSDLICCAQVKILAVCKQKLVQIRSFQSVDRNLNLKLSKLCLELFYFAFWADSNFRHWATHSLSLLNHF